VLLSVGLEELAAIHADELRHDTALLFEENLHFFRGLPLRPPAFFKDFDPTFCLSRVIVKAGFSLVIPDVGVPILPCFDLKSASRALVEIHATHGQFLPPPRLPEKLRYVGNAKWHISRELDTGGDIPASIGRFNRFLADLNTARRRLNPVDGRDDVGGEVDGDLPGDLNHECCTLIEKAFDSLDWCGHE
jgi:hypothetical protein